MVNKIRDSFLAAIENVPKLRSRRSDARCEIRLDRTKFVSMNNFQNKSFKTVS